MSEYCSCRMRSITTGFGTTGDRSAPLCPQPASVVVIAGCAHEHIVRVLFCSSCYQKWVGNTEPGHFCRACWDATGEAVPVMCRTEEVA